MKNDLCPYPAGTIASRIWERNKKNNSIENAKPDELKVIKLFLDGQNKKNISLLCSRSVASVYTILQRYSIKKEVKTPEKSNSDMIVESVNAI